MAETSTMDFEKEHKKKIFEEIDYLCSSERKLLSKIRTKEKYLDIDGNLPNTGITLNNKLIELMHLFQDAGISIFSQKFENYGPKKANFVSTSLIGDSIIFYLLDKINDGLEVLLEYEAKMNELMDGQQEKIRAFENSNPIKKFILIARSFIAFPPELDFSFSNEEIAKVTSYSERYQEIDDEIYSANLREITVPSIINYIKQKGYEKEAIPGIIDVSIVPYLEKLGLTDLIPELTEELNQLFEQPASTNTKSWELSPEQKEQILNNYPTGSIITNTLLNESQR